MNYDSAIAIAQRELPLRHAARFSSVFAYGAVDIDPKHLVVWVLLTGNPDDLPAWYFPHRDHVDPGQYDADLLTGIDAMRSAVVDCFAREGWPDAQHIHVGFDSADRVAAEGGWAYFK